MPPDVTQRFVDLLERADQPAAVRLVTGLAEQGITPEELVLEVLAPAQREVGRRWEQGHWSVAKEHAATAVTDTALGLLGLDAAPTETAHQAVVACVEGEWHALPARMAAEVLRLRGWEVTFLGPSVPADDLARYAGDQRPDVVGLSCSMPVSLKGAARSIQACREAGVPVLAGGSGFGPEGRYAARLGASGWAPDPVAAALLDAWLDEPASASPPPPEPADDEHSALEREKDDMVSAVLGGLDGHHGRLREALTFLLTTVETALFVSDTAVIGACRPAAARLLGDSGVPRRASASAVEALFDVVEGRFPRTWEVVKEGRLVDIERAI